MPWTSLNFGRHEGKTLPQVLFTDPDWFFWAYENGVFDDRATFLQEARNIHARSTSIRIPEDSRGPRQIEYVIHPQVQKFVGFQFVESTRPPHEGSSPTWRNDKLDMSFPRAVASYDKQGCSNLVRSMKFHFFGNESARMTKQRCEAFFDDLTNFHNSGE